MTHLKRLLVNIAGNAVKYSRRGGYVRLACREVEPVDGVPIYEYTIADNGIGMSEQFQQHLYEPFSREEQRVEGASSGTGLGAPIAKQLVELMGGSMSFTSTLGQGTTFTIRLPFEQCKRSEIPQAVRVDAVDVDAVRGLRVLLVEDNELNAEIAQFTLDRAGAIVTHVKDGESAVETFAASAPHEYDVVLMDIMMPGIDGLEATRQIRALEREDAATTPIIAVSANAFAEDRRLSREAGMDAHLSKPVSSRELVEALAHIAADASLAYGPAPMLVGTGPYRYFQDLLWGLLFMNLLAAKMLNRDLVELDALDVFGDLFFDFFGRRVVLKGELTDFVLDIRGSVIHQATTAKDNGTHNIGSPVIVLVPLVSVNGKADLVIALECVDLVAGFGAMEINLVVLGVEEVVDGNGVRVAIVAVDGKDAALAGGEQLARRLIGNGAFFSA